jgi:hypothetical protein
VQLIGDIVGERATVMVLPGLDHHFSRYPSRRAAFAGSGGTVDPGPVMDTLLPWLRVRR